MKVRLIKGEENYDPILMPDCFDTLKCMAIDAYGSVDFSYVYLNDEGDLKEINSDDELFRAITLMRTLGQDTLVILLENMDRFHSYTQEPVFDPMPAKTVPIKLAQNRHEPPDIIYELDKEPKETKLGKQKSSEYGMKPIAGKTHIEKVCRPDEVFEEKIKIRNNGVKVWEGVYLKLEKGTIEILSTYIPRLRPDETGEILMKIKAPSIKDTISLEFRMYTASGITFGSPIFYDLKVANPNLLYLLNMGFGEKDAQLALEMSGNNLDTAINSLLGDSLQEERENEEDMYVD